MPISRQTFKVKSPLTIILVWAFLLGVFWAALLMAPQSQFTGGTNIEAILMPVPVSPLRP